MEGQPPNQPGSRCHSSSTEQASKGVSKACLAIRNAYNRQSGTKSCLRRFGVWLYTPSHWRSCESLKSEFPTKWEATLIYKYLYIYIESCQLQRLQGGKMSNGTSGNSRWKCCIWKRCETLPAADIQMQLESSFEKCLESKRLLVLTERLYFWQLHFDPFWNYSTVQHRLVEEWFQKNCPAYSDEFIGLRNGFLIRWCNKQGQLKWSQKQSTAQSDMFPKQAVSTVSSVAVLV